MQELKREYNKMPRLHLLTWRLRPKIKQDIIEINQSDEVGKEYGLSLESLFVMDEVRIGEDLE